MENNNKVIFIIAIVIVILVTLIAILYANKVRPKPVQATNYDKIVSLGDSSVINEQSINGTYRLDYKDNMIAFDDTSGVVYVKAKNALYYYDSSIYQKVIDYCG